MGSTLVLVFLGLFVLLIGQAVVQRLLNPFADVEFGMLPEELRCELERILPSFRPGRTRLTRRADEARIEGEADARPIRVKADFDSQGRLVELEAEASGQMRTLERSTLDSLPAPASAEIDRVLGDPQPSFERSVVSAGTVGDEDHYEFKGLAGDWKWEIVVSAEGRLHEVEKELRGAQR